MKNGAGPELIEFKFAVQAVFLIVENGKTIGEQPTEARMIYGLDALRDFCDHFAVELAELNAKQKAETT